MGRSVGVFCASSNQVNPLFLSLAEELGREMARLKLELIFGGGKVGLMGAVSRGVHAEGGRVVGVIPKRLMHKEIAYTEADELLVTKDLFERKQIIIDRADGFLILPGGLGTLDELLEVMTLRQLSLHEKPIFILNIQGYFDKVYACFDHFVAEHAAPDRYREYFESYDEPESLCSRLAAFAA